MNYRDNNHRYLKVRESYFKQTTSVTLAKQILQRRQIEMHERMQKPLSSIRMYISCQMGRGSKGMTFSLPEDLIISMGVYWA